MPYTLKADNIVSVCMRCYPGLSIFLAFPNLEKEGRQVSHGLCPSCKAAFLAELRSLEKKSN